MQTYRIEGAAVPIPTREVYRYLGYRGITQDEALDQRVQFCIDQLHARSVPRSVWTRYACTPPATMSGSATTAGTSATTSAATPSTAAIPSTDTARSSAIPSTDTTSRPASTSPAGQNTTSRSDIPAPQLTIGPLQFESRTLSRNLRDCTAVVMMAATIGPGVDFLIRRAEATSMVDAAIYQAAGAAMVESWCDIVNERIRDEARTEGLYARPRFSPGYGDVPLALQTDFARVLNLAATCGISLSDSLLMSPSKSVTAFLGLGPTEERCPLAGCEVCNKAASCAYRR